MPGYNPTKHSFFFRQERIALVSLLLVILAALYLSSCQSIKSASSSDDTAQIDSDQSADGFLIVDCLLPGQVRKLGANMTFLTPRRPIKTSASDCEIRGGEYVSYDRADYSTALKIWLPIAKEGDAAAQTYVGEIYEKGLGIMPDYAYAAQWYSKASDQGFARAQINLGHLYENGHGVEKDLTKALNFYRMASGLGLGDDQLQFASTLTASYVPRKTYEATHQELVEQRLQSRLLKENLEKTRVDLDNKIAALNSAEQKLLSTEEKLQIAMKSSEDTIALLPPSLQSDQEEKYQNRIKDLTEKDRSLKEQVDKLARNNQELIDKHQALEKRIEQNGQIKIGQQKQLQAITTKLDNAERELQLSKQQHVALSTKLEQTKLQENSTDKIDKIRELEVSLAENRKSLNEQQQNYASLETSNNVQQMRIEKALKVLKLQSTRFSELAKKQSTQKEQLQESLEQQTDKSKSIHIELLQSRAQLQLSRVEHQRSITTIDQDNKNALDQQASKISLLLGQLDELQQQVGNQKTKIGFLENERDEYSSGLFQLADASPQSDAPFIEIIEPPVILTRSIPTVTLKSAIDTRLVIGKVLAPAGLLSFNINGKPEKIGDNDLFQVSIDTQANNTPVEVVAVDKLGRRVVVNFSIVRKSSELSESSPMPSEDLSALKSDSLKLGNYYALVIGNNDYEHMSTLATAINDATVTANVLNEKYRFKTTLLINAKRYEILSELNKFRQLLKPTDNLLIYYAGHGKLEKENSRGYWLPVDAEMDNSANWISNTAITDIINTMEAKHIIVVADSCYSGTLTQTSVARMEIELSNEARNEWIKVMADTKARITLTSGGLEPVLDGGGGKHSIFSKAFIETLQSNSGILEGYSLYHDVLTKVMQSSRQYGFSETSSQVPQYGPIHLAGHESGEFFFYPI